MPSEPKEGPVSYRSLPHKSQLAVLCLARLADPLMLMSVNSYIYFMIKFLEPGSTPAEIAAYVGILVTIKTAGKVATSMFWGRLSDSKFGGRKMTLLIGLISSCVSSVGFGFSSSLVAATFWQFLGSAMSSNIGILRTIVADLNPDKRYRSRALLLLPLFGGIGQFIGPLLGGFLSSTSETGIFKTFPYALPNLFIAGIYALAFLGVLFFVKETLEIHDASSRPFYALWVKVRGLVLRSDKYVEYGYSAIGSEAPVLLEDSPNPSPIVSQNPSFSGPSRAAVAQGDLETTLPPSLTFWQIWTPQVLATLLSNFIIVGHTGTFTALWVVFLSTPVTPLVQQPQSSLFLWTGGLGLSPASVGVLMSGLAGAGVLVQMSVYPWLSDRFSTIRILRATLLVYPIMYIIAPLPALVASHFTPNGDSDVGNDGGVSLSQRSTAVIAVVALVLGLQTIGRMGVLPGITLLINECVPAQSARGTINTAGTTMGNLSKCIFPPLAMLIYGWGLEHGVVGLGFWILSGLAVVAVFTSYLVKDTTPHDGDDGKRIEV